MYRPGNNFLPLKQTRGSLAEARDDTRTSHNNWTRNIKRVNAISHDEAISRRSSAWGGNARKNSAGARQLVPFYRVANASNHRAKVYRKRLFRLSRSYSCNSHKRASVRRACYQEKLLSTE